ncbi:hypothetical protein [Adhaeribacter aquaticus]|uniref:hypothetical protein n=1 Tax=Adhaeribacter aquaticus TaxID=299567 RepID=UPI0004018755|nr:hypothetical protein [Adhaeribacter aquaticus]
MVLLFSFSGKAQDANNATDSDKKAVDIATKVIKNMGGTDGWNKTRYIAWTWRNQYHVWDKYENKFRLERDTLVVVADLNTKQGKAYSKGKDISDSPQGQKLIQSMYPVWVNDSYWLIMPFKLKDSGVTLKYKGEGKTKAGEEADLLELTFENVGVTPNNKYVVAVDKKSGLVTEWSFYRSATDEKPGFTRAWNNYKTYGKIKMASGRAMDGDPKMDMSNIAVSQNIPAAVFNSPLPMKRL